MSADLLPCPFCGSANVGEPIRRRPLQVACIDCGGEGPEAHTVDEARTAWNTRADDSPPPADADLLALANRTLAADLAKVRADRDRLAAWLADIEGGDNHCDDAATLRRWAYEALTLGREVSNG